jgi:membrane protein implicated in regulation of membrane protease activity
MEELAIYAGIAVALIALDAFVPSAGLLSGAGIALLIERALAEAGVAWTVRVPLAAIGMMAVVGLAVRYGERISERLSPLKERTNVDRLVGLRGQVLRLHDGDPVVELEGDLWTSTAEGEVVAGDLVEVMALVDQVPIVRKVER